MTTKPNINSRLGFGPYWDVTLLVISVLACAVSIYRHHGVTPTIAVTLLILVWTVWRRSR